MASWKYDRDDQQHHGMEPVGYDADTGVYTYRDEQGNHYDTAEGSGRYGNLQYTHTTASTAPQSGFNGEGISAEVVANDWRMMKPFFLLIAVVLLTLLWYVNSAGSGSIIVCRAGLDKYKIVKGDTCWDIAEARKTTVEKLVNINSGLACESLQIGRRICVPSSN